MVKLPFCLHQLTSGGFVTHDSLGGSITIGRKITLREGAAGYLKREAKARKATSLKEVFKRGMNTT